MGSFCNPLTRVPGATPMVAELQPDGYNSEGAVFNFFRKLERIQVSLVYYNHSQ